MVTIILKGMKGFVLRDSRVIWQFIVNLLSNDPETNRLLSTIGGNREMDQLYTKENEIFPTSWHVFQG